MASYCSKDTSYAAREPITEACYTVDPDIHEYILAAAARDGVSVSAWMTAAARQALQRRADRNERRAWAEHKVRLELGVIPLVPAPVVAQVSGSPQQAQLRRFLTGCVVVSRGEAGRLLGMTKTPDVVDAVLMTTALRQKAAILTGDAEDIERLVRASGREVAVVAI